MRYSDEISKMIEAADAKEGSKILLTVSGSEYTGILMPHKDSSAPDIIVIKMKNGYYAGLRIGKGDKIKVLEQPVIKETATVSRKPKKELPDIVLIGTGGTIGSQADAGSGTALPVLSAERLLETVPDIFGTANIKARSLMSVFSENIRIKDWQEMAKAVEEEMNAGADAVIISHGTDTMGYSAAALSFMLRELSGPVVFTGAQRSPERPSSDAPGNLSAAVRFCVSSKAAGVYAVMHDTMNDDSYAVHRGTRVRKMHTSRRDAFRSINTVPAAKMNASEIIITGDLPAPSKKTVVKPKMEEKVILLHYFPGMDPAVFRDAVMGSKGVVIAGTGLGHVSDGIASLLKDAVDNGTVVVMTSQCINGPTGMNVYDTGRKLQRSGVIPVTDMLPETAYVKLMWVLANSKDVKEAKEMMVTPLSYEMGNRRTADVIW